MVPSAQSMTSGASQDGDTDTDTGGANADEGVDAKASRSGLRVATNPAGGDGAAPALLKGDAATASPKAKKTRPPVDVRVETRDEDLYDASGTGANTGGPTREALTPSRATGNEALGQWARALGREDQDNSFKRRAGAADAVPGPGPGFFVPAPSEASAEASGAADAGEASRSARPAAGSAAPAARAAAAPARTTRARFCRGGARGSNQGGRVRVSERRELRDAA